MTKVKSLEVFIRKLSSSCPARSLRGSLGGLDHGFGRYLHRGKGIIHPSIQRPANDSDKRALRQPEIRASDVFVYCS